MLRDRGMGEKGELESRRQGKRRSRCIWGSWARGREGQKMKLKMANKKM